MRKTLITSAIGAVLAVSACSNDANSPASTDTQSLAAQSAAETTHKGLEMTETSTNVLLAQSPLPYQAPPFDKIRTSDYEPAFAEGLRLHAAEIAAIAENDEPATFANTIVALEKSGEVLGRVSQAFFGLSGVISDNEYQRIESEMAPKLSAHQDSIYLNARLFARVAAVYNDRDKLNAEDQRLVDFYYKQFVRAGAELSDADKERMRDINAELSTLSTDFSQNILKSFKEDVTIVTDKSQLAGLSENEIATLAAAAKEAGHEGYLITLVNTTRQPLLSSLENRELRQKLWQTSAQRAFSTNGPLLLKQVQLRAEKAKLLGFADWASYVTADQMALNPQAVYGILDDLAPKAVARARAEAVDIEAEIRKVGGEFTLQPWDWAYYAEKVRKARYDFDENLIKPYFELNTVLRDGLFYAMEKLYGITFKAREDLPVYHPDVRVFEVFNEDGSTVGLFYFDPYAREGKRGGAWMDEFVTQSDLLGTKPVVLNVLNIPKPAAGQPTLMTFDEVGTLFHEFGHAAHGLFSRVNYPSLAGTATARDFVEFPSQFNEDWCVTPEVIAHYAKHYKTGEPIPQVLLDKVLKSRQFNKGFDTTEYLAAALLDMEWHSIPAGANIEDINAFEKTALAKHGIDYTPVPPRYKSAYFSHIFAGGYSAGYYAYLWTEVFAADAFAHMKENGGLTRENGDRFRQEILSRGNSRDLMQDYINFRGEKPSTDALLIRRGLVE